MTKTAVVILNWNGKHYLEKFVPVLIKNTPNTNTKLYVADNGSSDDSVAFLKKNFPEINLILFDVNYGFTGGYNKALKQIEAEYYVLLNSDIEVTPNWTEPLVDILDNDKNVAAVAPKIKSYHDKNSFEYAGAAGGFIDKYGYPFCRGRVFSSVEKDEGQFEKMEEIFWASGACLVIRADLYNDSGGLDEDFFAHMEEIDLCWRLKNKGYKILYTNKSEVFHVGGGALPNDSPRKIFLNHRNNLLLLLKNIPKGKLFLTLFIRFILDGISALFYLASGKSKFFFAVFKAHIAFYALISKFWKKRKGLIKQNKNHKEIYKKSIVFDFYLRKKRTFNKLKF